MNVTNNQNHTQKIARRLALVVLSVMKHNGLSGASAKSANRGARHLSIGLQLTSPKELSKALGLSEQIALSSNVPSVLTFRSGNEVVYQFGLREHLWKTYTRQNTPNDAIGFAESEQPVIFQFDDARPHTAFAGTTGSGKTESIKSTVYSLATSYKPSELKIILVDCFDNFSEFDNLAHLAIPRAVNADDIEQTILFAESQLKQRIANSDKKSHRLVFIADETETIFNDDSKVERLKAIAKTGRQFRINLILGSQDFKEKDLPGVVKELNNRFVGLVQNASVSARLTGQAGLEAHKLLGKGDFLSVAGSKTVRFQVSQVLPSDTQDLPRAEIQPVIVDNPASEVISNFAETLPENKGGRPKLDISPELAASYVYQFPKVISFREAEKVGISRRQHEALREFTLDFMKAYIQLMSKGLKDYLK